MTTTTKTYTPEDIKHFAEWLEGEAVRIMREQAKRDAALRAGPTTTLEQAEAKLATMSGLALRGIDENPYEYTQTAQTLRLIAIRKSL